MPPEHLRIMTEVLAQHATDGCQARCLELARELVKVLKKHNYRIQKVKYEDVETGDE